MFEALQEIIKASRERCEVCERVQRQLSLPATAHVHVRELQSGSSIQTVITVIEPESIRKYRIAKAPAAITEADVQMLLAG
ncbi:MAG TPA: hypothetical protein VK604_27355 [Bryobacteraceae bacterium]|nr:hypothetical protein [Bryobacteraceae bacterium]